MKRFYTIYHLLGLFTLLFALLFTACESNDAANSPSNTGQGGSLAQFSIVGDYLYIVDNENLKVVNVANPDQALWVGEQSVGFGIETLFHYKGNLFIGSETGMFIYDISDPERPQQLSEYVHFESCDPVVANDSIAFVTLRSGQSCRFQVDLNQMEILDISNLNSPNLIDVIQMNNPRGLGISDTMLYVCDGASGLQSFNIKNPSAIQPVETIENIFTNDVIVLEEILMVIGPENLYQYSLNKKDRLELLSTLDLINF